VKSDRLNLRPLRTGLVVVGVLAATGWALDPLEQPAWAAVRATEPALKLDTLQAALGQGITVGLLGGFRSLVADFLWIKGEYTWEDHDLPGSLTCYQLATTLDPRRLYFWIDASQRIANDMPYWRIEAEGGSDKVPRSRQEAIFQEQNQAAVRFLQNALAYHPNAPTVLEAIANVYYFRAKDYREAANYYRLAALQQAEPSFAGRQTARMLQLVGRNQEAYDWLKQRFAFLPKPPGSPGSKAGPTGQPVTVKEQTDQMEVDEMLENIRKLEATLGIPPSQAFRP